MHHTEDRTHRPDLLRCWRHVNRFRVGFLCLSHRISGAAGLATFWESIGAGMTTSESAMQAWMGSQGHKETLLRRERTKRGVGVFRGAGGDGIY